MEKRHKIEAVFIDRDGTIGGDNMVHYPGEFELFPYSLELISKLKSDGIKVFSFTNQPGISAGKADRRDFIEELTGFGFDDIFICPHSQHAGCHCRKPDIGMLLDAKQKHNLRLQNCIVIGDRWSDIAAASDAGCIKILVRTGAGESTLNEHYEKIKDMDIDYVANDLREAIAWLYLQYEV